MWKKHTINKQENKNKVLNKEEINGFQIKKKDKNYSLSEFVSVCYVMMKGKWHVISDGMEKGMKNLT